MAPVLDKSSPLVTAEVTIAGVKVVALIDTGATSSCCRWGWYDQWKNHLGPLKQTDTLVIGVGNVPVELKGITQVLDLEWDCKRPLSNGGTPHSRGCGCHTRDGHY